MSHVTITRRPRRVVVLSQIINLQISMSHQYCLLFYAAIATIHATLLGSANWLVHDIRQQIQGGHRHFLRSVGQGDDAAIRALAREEVDDAGAMGTRLLSGCAGERMQQIVKSPLLCNATACSSDAGMQPRSWRFCWPLLNAITRTMTWPCVSQCTSHCIIAIQKTWLLGSRSSSLLSTSCDCK